MNPAGSHTKDGAPLPPSFLAEGALAQGLQLISPHGIFTTDTELRITSWNEWLVVHGGQPAAAAIGRHLREIAGDLQDRRLLARYERVLKGEVSVLSTALHKYLLAFPSTVPESGQAHMLQTARIAPLRDGDRIIGTVTVIEDVSQREYQSATLLKQQEMDRLLSFALGVLLKANDPVTEISAIFSQVIPLLGLDAFVCYLSDGPTQLRLQAASGITTPQRDAIAVLPLSAAEETAIAQSADFTQLSIASHAVAIQRLNFRSSINFPLAAGRRLFGLVSFASYERAVISAANLKVLARIAGYVAIALDRASRERAIVAASHAKDDFLAALSHELRTPLNPVVLIASDAARNAAYSPEVRESFRMIEKNAQLEARLIDDLLDLTKVERGKLTLDLQKVDAHAVLADAIGTVRGDASDAQLTLSVALTAAHSLVLADFGRLQQVFWNVVKNSVKFTPAGGDIRISTSVEGDNAQLVVQVRDTGIGMHPEEVGRIFNAFTQGDHSVEGRPHRFGGLGLGLAITQKILELHGGRIEAASSGKGKGSTITIRLPLVQASASPLLPAESNPADRDGGLPAVLGARLLLVEDHEATRSTMKMLLEKRGYEVVDAGTCAGALRAAEAQTFDLVLSDLGLPDGDGVELMSILRERFGLKGIALTGYGMEHDIQRSNQAGFIAHLTKPINASLLDRTINQVFEASSED